MEAGGTDQFKSSMTIARAIHLMRDKHSVSKSPLSIFIGLVLYFYSVKW